MDNKVANKLPKSKGDLMFQAIKQVIIEENKHLLKLIARKYKRDYATLEEKYIRPEYYLPLVIQ